MINQIEVKFNIVILLLMKIYFFCLLSPAIYFIIVYSGLNIETIEIFISYETYQIRLLMGKFFPQNPMNQPQYGFEQSSSQKYGSSPYLCSNDSLKSLLSRAWGSQAYSSNKSSSEKQGLIFSEQLQQLQLLLKLILELLYYISLLFQLIKPQQLLLLQLLLMLLLALFILLFMLLLLLLTQQNIQFQNYQLGFGSYFYYQIGYFYYFTGLKAAY
ncbi:transmembrane protein, putative (macronuclear) [Tetrahymena thermophila SB210]|uniref:Transmembrane protein, putative n=1 Tax=Tetrahymena thermophila (strain SB210) TaxID=312017 RepID=W7X5U5_TETTS|nr:transmembrane protein, putative [Tetrahymena thermophila SB210]EWS71728.1 transmembrane protein, putative [Tetrahymena thermophila SB210]|eukprot:XP_012655736.1 transmembrane protein, putative [Tetrahymena thermophila SB210]